MNDDKLSPLEQFMLHNDSGIRRDEALQQIQERVPEIVRYEMMPGRWIRRLDGELIWLIPYLTFYFKSGGSFTLPLSDDPDVIRGIRREIIEDIVYALLKHLRERVLRTDE